MTNTSPALSLGARVSIAALAVLAWTGGWIVVLMGGFHHMPHRRASYTVFVDGPGALVMASISFLIAALGVLALLQHARAGLAARILGVCAVLVPPCAYVLLGGR